MSDKTYTLNEIVESVRKHYSFLFWQTNGERTTASASEAHLVLAVIAGLDEAAHAKWTVADITQILVNGNVMPQEEAQKFATSCVDEYNNVTLY
jgi:predicted glycosyltransferase